MATYDTIQIGFSSLVSQTHWEALDNQILHFGKIEKMKSVVVDRKKVAVYSFYDIRGAFSAFKHFTSVGFIESADVDVLFVEKISLREKPITNDILGPLASFMLSYSYAPTPNTQEAANIAHSTDFPLPNTLLADKNEDFVEFLKNGSLDMNQFASDTNQRLNHKTLWEHRNNHLANSDIVTKANVAKNNVIDIRRIAQGLDTRTTVMLRNIPNKVDQQMLKDYLDVTNKYTYDFLCE